MSIESETRDVSGFSAVDLRGFGTVIVDQSGTEGLRIEARRETLDLIETEVHGDTLRLGFKPRWLLSRPKGPVTFYVSAREINGLSVSGSGTMRSARIEAPQLSLGISGSGDITIDWLSTGDIHASITGSGSTRLAGTASSLDLRISGSGKYLAEQLECRSAAVRVTGSGDATLRVSDELNVSVTGSGDVRYIGEPRVQLKSTGSGRVRQLAAH